MGIGAISWKMQINSMLKLIRVTGVALNDEDSQWVLDCGIVEMLELAMKNNGAFVPLTDFPEIREKGNFVYFEVIFKSRQDFNNYLNDCEM